MLSELFPLLILLGFFVLLIGGILLVAYLASQSRKKKQTKLLDQIPKEAEFSAFVRFNRGKQQDKFMKVKAFEGSGVIYLIDENVYFKGTKGFNHTFNLRNSKVFWEGENLVNGLLKWFSIGDADEKLYLNVETGMFIFHTGGDKSTTRSIHDEILLKQATLK